MVYLFAPELILKIWKFQNFIWPCDYCSNYGQFIELQRWRSYLAHHFFIQVLVYQVATVKSSSFFVCKDLINCFCFKFTFRIWWKLKGWHTILQIWDKPLTVHYYPCIANLRASGKRVKKLMARIGFKLFMTWFNRVPTTQR